MAALALLIGGHLPGDVDMRILVEPTNYIYINAGDMAMQHACIRRLGELWPDATIQVLSDVPDLMPAYCPNAVPLNARGRRIWLSRRRRTLGYAGNFANHFLSRIGGLKRCLDRRWSSLTEWILKPRRTWRGTGDRDLHGFLDAVAKADLVVVVGMGGITDAFPEFAEDLLHAVGLATRCGAPTVMVGQGIGPLKDPKLVALAEAVLPRVDLVCLREERAGGPLLRMLGVLPERVMTTGDDAIELAYQARPKELGDSLGVSLRVASYSGVGQSLVEQLGPVLQDAAKTCQARMIPIPISRHPDERDALVIRELVDGYSYLSDAGDDPDSWQEVIEQIARCRVVVAGSYHAGVFALSQGIPVVGLAASDYYVDKFLGLADQFGTGCEVIRLKDAQWPEKLATAVGRAWQAAEQLRPRVLEAAERQIESGRVAYQRIYRLVHARAKGTMQ